MFVLVGLPSGGSLRSTHTDDKHLKNVKLCANTNQRRKRRDFQLNCWRILHAVALLLFFSWRGGRRRVFGLFGLLYHTDNHWDVCCNSQRYESSKSEETLKLYNYMLNHHFLAITQIHFFLFVCLILTESKHGGNRNGKKEGLSGSSFFTWFMVIALLGVWTSVAVVWFELVDYEEVLGKNFKSSYGVIKPF